MNTHHRAGVVNRPLKGGAVLAGALSRRVLARFPGAALTDGDANYFWQAIVGCRWAHSSGTLVKCALTPEQVIAFAEWIRAQTGARGWVSAGGNAGFISLPAGTPLPALAWPAVMLRGDGPLWPGPQREFAVMRAVKSALDPSNRFPNLDE